MAEQTNSQSFRGRHIRYKVSSRSLKEILRYVPGRVKFSEFRYELDSICERFNEAGRRWRTWFDVLGDRSWKHRIAARVATDDTVCPICRDDLEGTQKMQPIACKHVFHGECLKELVNKHKEIPRVRCPVCRTPLLSKRERERDKRIEAGVGGIERETGRDRWTLTLVE